MSSSLNNINDKIFQSLSKVLTKFESFIYKNTKTDMKYQQQNIELIGQKIFGIDQGEQFYKIKDTDDDVTKIRAGKMIFNKKVGDWKVLKNDQKQKLIWHNVRYEEGKEIIMNFIEEQNILLPGELNQNKLKNGKYVVLDNNEIVTQIFKNGVKVGLWKKNEMDLFDNRIILQESFGGSFDNEGNKLGKWIETDEMFQSRGCYKNGLKEGKWIQVKQLKTYNEQNNNLNLNQKEGCLSWEGQYSKDNKIGEWKIIYNGSEIGYGNYDDQQKKTGFWREIDFKSFSLKSQVIMEGQYQEDIRVGKWLIYYNNQQIGGGIYNEKGVKIGKWKDINPQQNGDLKIFEVVYQNGNQN